MIDISNEGLLNNNNLNNNNILFDSISEKQEESSSTIKNSKIKNKFHQKNNISAIKSNHDLSKDVINISNISIKKRSNVKSVTKKKKSIKITYINEEKDKIKEMIRLNRRGTSKKKTKMLSKRISFQHDNQQFFLNKLKNNEDYKKVGSVSGKNMPGQQSGMNNNNKSFFREKKSLNISMNQHKINTLTGLYSKNSIIGHTLVKNKSVNLSNSDYLDMKYFHKKNIKHTILTKGKLNDKDQRNTNSTVLFEKLKESYLFEKSEALLYKIRICYGFLGVFSFLSILLEIIDVIIFYKKSEEYLHENYNIIIYNVTNPESYHYIEKRKITKR